MSIWCRLGLHDYRPVQKKAKTTSDMRERAVWVWAPWLDCTHCGKRRFPRGWSRALRRQYRGAV